MPDDGDADVGGEDPEEEVDGKNPQLAPSQAGAEALSSSLSSPDSPGLDRMCLFGSVS